MRIGSLILLIWRQSDNVPFEQSGNVLLAWILADRKCSQASRATVSLSGVKSKTSTETHPLYRTSLSLWITSGNVFQGSD